MHEHEAVQAIWVKDEQGKIVHLTEFDDRCVMTEEATQYHRCFPPASQALCRTVSDCAGLCEHFFRSHPPPNA